MSLRIGRVMARRRVELLLTLFLFILASSLTILGLGPLKNQPMVILGEKLAFALIVALIVRWLTIAFTEIEPSTASDSREYHEAILAARDRIWLLQTWLPGIDCDATEILQGKARDVKVLLSSCQNQSPIYARIVGRRITVTTLKKNLASSALPFVLSKRQGSLRFNWGHHPGWIALIDSYVFWGPTPVHVNIHAVDFLFHRHPANSPEGEFWTSQFRILWDSQSHGLEHELEHNEELRAVIEAGGA